jgi:uncharacterized membrane protein YqaE (UPF0057 family)
MAANPDGTAASMKPDGTSAAYGNAAPPPMSPYMVGGSGPRPGAVLVAAPAGPDPCISVLALLWCFILPPVAVALAGGDLASILFNVLFTMLGWFPGASLVGSAVLGGVRAGVMSARSPPPHRGAGLL